MTSAKLSASDLIEQADIYRLLGIDRAKCDMPHISPKSNMGRGSMISDPTSAGHHIYTALQPALENLATAHVLKQNASFFDHGLEQAKNRVTNELVLLLVQSAMSGDKEGIAGLLEECKSMHEAVESMSALTDQVSDSLANKVRVASTAASRVR